MKRYTVTHLARLSGVSVRALHHYDEIGLLKPAYVGDNGYRYYEEDELVRLQQILLHRELGFPLLEIGAILDRPGFDRIAALQGHRELLTAQAQRYRQLVRTIDRTIAELEGDRSVQHENLYKGFAPEKQAEYEQWLVDRYGGEMRSHIDHSKARFSSLSDEQRQKIMSDLAQLESDLAEACRRRISPESTSLDPLLDRHRAWVAYMWDRPCPPQAYAGLADLYLSHPDFRTRYETLEPGFCDYLTTAMKVYAERQGGDTTAG